MNLKDYDFINECVNFLNGFSANPIKPLSADMVVTGQQVEQYRKAVEMTLKSKKSLPNFSEYEIKAKSANDFLDKLLKYKKISRIPRV